MSPHAAKTASSERWQDNRNFQPKMPEHHLAICFLLKLCDSLFVCWAFVKDAVLLFGSLPGRLKIQHIWFNTGLYFAIARCCSTSDSLVKSVSEFINRIKVKKRPATRSFNEHRRPILKPSGSYIQAVVSEHYLSNSQTFFPCVTNPS